MSDAGFLIRQASHEDGKKLIAIAQASYGVYLGRMEKKPFPMLDDYYQHIRNGSAYLLETGGIIAAFLILLEEGGTSLLLDNIAVHPDFQKRGFGLALMRFAEEEACRRNYSVINLYTNAVMTENQAWYARLGYQETERRMDKGYQRIFFRKFLKGEQGLK